MSIIKQIDNQITLTLMGILLVMFKTPSEFNSQEKKVTLIADSIYNTIRISTIEKEIISIDVFNRLHNILENSTAYLTFPSLRTSRFAHSLGCMHIAGMIFQQGIINAKDETRLLFFDSAQDTINNAKSCAFTAKIINQFFTSKYDHGDLDQCLDSIGESLKSDALYSFITPSSVSSEEHHWYVIIYQAVRIAALLHDLGHPPFSHIIENSLSDLYYFLESEMQKNQTLENDEQKIFYRIIKGIKEGDQGKEKNRKIHEIIGNRLAEYVLAEIISNTQKNNSTNVDQLICDTTIICQIALGILNDGENYSEFKNNKDFLRSLHNIISGELDADRLDYLERDLRNSNNSGHLSYDRLLAGFCLISSQDEKGLINPNIPKFEFVPSIQALASIEEFFKKRFDLYQVVIFHHHVAKTDGLLAEAVFRLSMKYLSNENNYSETIKAAINKENNLHNFLTPDIYWLWKILDLQESTYNWKIANKYFQWDDSWLLNCLRRQYIEIKELIINSKKGLDYTNNDELLAKDTYHVYPILEELLTNKKKYISLYKRPSDFKVVDEAFLNSAISDSMFDWTIIQTPNENKSLKVINSLKNMLSYLETYKSILNEDSEHIAFPYPKNIEELRINRGYFINVVLEYMMISDVWSNDKKQNLFWKAINYIKKSASDSVDNYFDADIIPLFKVLKPGVSDDFHIAVKGKIEHLGKYSRVVQDLTLASNLFPPFFVAIFKYDKDYSDQELLEMQAILGVSLWKAFSAIIQEDLSNMQNSNVLINK